MRKLTAKDPDKGVTVNAMQPESRPEPQYDAVTRTPTSLMLGLSPFIGAAIGLYLWSRGIDNLLFSAEFLNKLSWFAVLPFERQFLPDPPHPFLLELMLIANVYCLFLLIIGIPFALAPRPIAVSRIGGKYVKPIAASFFLVFIFLFGRVLCADLASKLLADRPPPKGGGVSALCS